MIVLRILLGIVAALAFAFVGVILVELLSAVVHPIPADFGNTKEEMCAHVANYPQWVLAVVTFLWLGIIFGSIYIAQRLGSLAAGIVVGGLLLWALALNVYMLPYPIWFKVVMLGGFPLAAFGAFQLRKKPRSAVPAE